MAKYKIKATNDIAKIFEEKKYNFRLNTYEDLDVLVTDFYVECGPHVEVECIVENGYTSSKDVVISIFSLISKIPKEKRARAIEACNIMNVKHRFARFYLTERGDIRVDYTICKKGIDESIGKIVFSTIIIMQVVLDENYEIIAKALYTDEDLERYYEESEEEAE